MKQIIIVVISTIIIIAISNAAATLWLLAFFEDKVFDGKSGKLRRPSIIKNEEGREFIDLSVNPIGGGEFLNP